jgi:glycosyltransferase involved in cell wall biosynthesis
LVLTVGRTLPTGPRLAVFFHPRFSDGGVERTNIYLARALLQAGYAVDFLTTTATEHFRSELGQLGIGLVQMGDRRTLEAIPTVIRYLKDAARRHVAVDLISCQYYVNVIAMLIKGMLWGYHGRIRFVNSERNHYCELWINGGVKNIAVLILVRLLYRFADRIIANSQETADDLSKLIGRTVTCVYNPTINDRLLHLMQEPIREAWFLDDKRPCVIAIGRLSPQKGFDSLIAAFAAVRRRIDCRLVILGDGELRGSLERQVAEMGLNGDVYLPGFVPNPYKFLSASDLFVLSSRYEGLPNVLIEAVYLRVPCVATSCKSGPREVLINGQGGRLVPPDDVGAMAAAIEEVLRNPAEARARAERAHAEVARFRYETVAAQFKAVLAS